MKAAVIAFSEKGAALGQCILEFFQHQGHTAQLTRCPPEGLAAWTQAHFKQDALIFIGSCGIAVRAAAPFLRDKTSDPAIVVVDELATYAVSLLSGHIGGANALAAELGQFLGAMPVITTATDCHGVFAIDTWAACKGLKIANPGRIKEISWRLLAGETLRLQSSLPILGPLPPGLILWQEAGDIIISHRAWENETALHLIPPVLTLGIGCKKNIPPQDIETAFRLMLENADFHPLAVARVCSVDLKAQEPGILSFCRSRSLPYHTFTAPELMAAPGCYPSSAFVRQITGADNICERSAVLGSGEGGKLIAPGRVTNGVKMALAIAPYTLSFKEATVI